MGVRDNQLIYVIYDESKEVVGVMTGFKKSMKYVYDHPGYTCKEFRANELTG